jgi:hypothetical protein
MRKKPEYGLACGTQAACGGVSSSFEKSGPISPENPHYFIQNHFSGEKAASFDLCNCIVTVAVKLGRASTIGAFMGGGFDYTGVQNPASKIAFVQCFPQDNLIGLLQLS